MTHCWKSYQAHIEETFGWCSDEHLETYSDEFRDGTCMLPEGHEGEHVFTPDDEIEVEFS